MSWVALLLVVLWTADAIRLRRRLGELPRLTGAPSEPQSEPQVETPGSGWRALCAPGVQVSQATLQRAIARAERLGWEAADLIPGDLATENLLGLLATYEPEKWREDPFRPARTAAHVLLVKEALAPRVGLPPSGSPDLVVLAHQPDATSSSDVALSLTRSESDALTTASVPAEGLPSVSSFLTLAAELRRCAQERAGLLIADGLQATEQGVSTQRQLMDAVAGRGTPFLLAAQGLIFGLLFLCLLYAPWWGLLAVLGFQLQPLLVFWKSGLAPHDLTPTLIARAPISVARWFSLLRAPALSDEAIQGLATARQAYAEAIAEGTAPFFEPRRTACPLCKSEALSLHLETRDLFQHKPGTFHIERCEGCGLMFQNPRLSLQGLGYYYRDFYDGLGEKSMESVFGASLPAYQARAEMLRGFGRPTRWLDVGGGHGHFCALARRSWPKAKFEILDLADSVDDAVRRGWADAGYQGLFPELADKLEPYDVVSMSHYLEHTREPAEEIAAAAKVLAPGGHLLVEVPDPESMLGRVLGRYWVPYFQPQHQHFLSAQHLEQLFQDNGLVPVRWHRGSAHIPVDFLMAAWILVSDLAGSPGKPWKPAPTLLDRLRYNAAWAGLFWLLPAGWLLDRLLKGSLSRGGRSNAYRVLARKAE